MNTTAQQLNTVTTTSNVQAPTVVPFHGRDLYLVKHNHEPYVPMRPVVTGMGLAWQTQQKKLSANSSRWGTVTLRVTVGKDGKSREMVSIPLRKLFGWMSTIQVSRVKPESQEAVKVYQDECDDALARYWTQGIAINPRLPLTPRHQRELQKAIAGRIYSEVPAEHRSSAFKRVYSHLKDRFEVGSYKDIDDSQYTEALGAIQSFALEGDLLPPKATNEAVFSDRDLSDLYILLCHVHWIYRHWTDYRMDEALRMLQSPAAAQMCEHMSMADTYKTLIGRAKGELLEESRRRLGLNYGIFPIH